MVPFRLAAAWLAWSVVSVRAQGDGLSQQYCSNENTGSNYQAGELKSVSISSHDAKADSAQSTTSISPTARVTISAKTTTLLPSCSGRTAGAPITSLRNSKVSAIATRTARDILPSNAEIKAQDCTGTYSCTDILRARQEGWLALKRAARLPLLLRLSRQLSSQVHPRRHRRSSSPARNRPRLPRSLQLPA